MQYFSEALGFCSKYFYLYRRKYFLLLWDYSTSGSKAQAVKSNVILQHAVSFSPFFTFSQTSCLLFEKLVFHGEEHHQSNSKKNLPNILSIEHLVSLESSCWQMQVTRENVSFCESDSPEFTLRSCDSEWRRTDFIPKLEEKSGMLSLRVHLMLCPHTVSLRFCS